jgi:PAS domain S-box-containing protein
MLATLRYKFNQFLEHPLYPIQAILLLCTIGATLFAFTEQTGGTQITNANLCIAILSFLAFLLLSFTPLKKSVTELSFFFIASFNLLNISIIHFSDFAPKFYFQYIIFFLLSSLLVNSSKTFLYNLVTNLIGIGIITYLHGDYASIFEFHSNFIFSVLALIILGYRRFRMNTQVQISEEKYRLLAEYSADVICTHRQGGNFIFVSPSIIGLSGYEHSELVGKSPTDWIHPDDLSVFISNFFSEYKPSEFNVPIQYRFKQKSGGYIWVETIVRVIDSKNKNKLPETFLSQTRSFQRNKEYLSQLEANTQKLEKSYKDLEMFAYVTSHDMQEPLRMISNYIQLVKRKISKTPHESDIDEYIGYTIANTTNLQTLIRDILTYSTSNKVEVPENYTETETILQEILASIQPLLNEREVEVMLPTTFVPLKIEKNYLLQVFQNLILNGIKYNMSDRPMVEVFCSESASEIIYGVKDNGIGIDEKYFEKIFEPFQRLHNKYDFPGTGLGLAICQKIIEKHNGKMWVSSEEGVGSIFYFSTPK